VTKRVPRPLLVGLDPRADALDRARELLARAGTTDAHTRAVNLAIAQHEFSYRLRPQDAAELLRIIEAYGLNATELIGGIDHDHD